MQRAFTPAQDQEIGRDYAAGTSPDRLAQERGVSRNAIYSAVKRSGTPLRGQGEVAGNLHKGRAAANRLFRGEDEQRLLQAYQAGRTAASLALENNTCTTVVTRTLSRLGVAIRPQVYPPKKPKLRKPKPLVHPNRRWSDEAELAMVEEYAAGQPAAALAREHGTSVTSITRILRRRGVTIGKPKHRFLPLNEAAFDHAEGREASAYFVGLLMADGCVHYRRETGWVTLHLAAEDADHVLEYRSFLGSGHKIGVRPNKAPDGQPAQDVHSLGICSTRLADALARYGVVPRKSETAEVKVLEGNRHFWRGMVCGDGSVFVSRNRPQLFLCGSRQNMESFRRFCLSVTPSEATIQPHYSIWAFRLCGGNAYRVIEHLFGDVTVGLPRKMDAAKAILKDFARWKTVCKVWRRREQQT